MHSYSAIKSVGVVLKYDCEGFFSISEDVLIFSESPGMEKFKADRRRLL